MAVKFVNWLNPTPSQDWLDIGCGTGALTESIVQKCDPASVLGIDPSDGFIDEARRRVKAPNVSFTVGGVQDIPQIQGGYDAIVSGLVLNFIPDPVEAVRLMAARVHQDGTVAAYVWDYAEGMEFLRYFWDEAIIIEPSAADLDEGRRFPLCNPKNLASTFENAGLRNISSASLEIETPFSDFSDYWSPFQGSTGPAPSFLDSLDSENQEKLRQRLMRKLPIQKNGSILIRARAWAVRGSA